MEKIVLFNQSLEWYPASSLEEGRFDVSEFLSLILLDDPSAVSVEEGDQDIDRFLGLGHRRIQMGCRDSRSTEYWPVGIVYDSLVVVMVLLVVMLQGLVVLNFWRMLYVLKGVRDRLIGLQGTQWALHLEDGINHRRGRMRRLRYVIMYRFWPMSGCSRKTTMGMLLIILV